MTILNTVQNGFFRCAECDYIVEVYDAPQSFSIKCHRCDEYLVQIGDKSKIELDKYAEELSYWLSFGCPECLCESVNVDCSDEDTICCECPRTECLNYEVFLREDAS